MDKTSKIKDFQDLSIGYQAVTRKDDNYLELKKVNELFNDCYKLYKNFSQMDLLDNDLQDLIKISDLINKKYNTEFSKSMVLAVIDEIERIEKKKHGKTEQKAKAPHRERQNLCSVENSSGVYEFL